MALPVTITAVKFPDQNYYCGPFKAPNGAVYVVFKSTLEDPEVHKCVDFDFPASAFVHQTGGTEPALGTPGPQWAYLSGNHIHVISYRDSGTSIYYYYSRFDTSDDSWEVADQEIDMWDDKYEPVLPGCSFVYREDDGGQDPYVCQYNGPMEKIGGSYYDRVSYATDADGAGSWTNATNAVDAGGEMSYSGGASIRGSAPDANGHVVHFFYGVAVGTSGYCRTLRYSSGWQLSTEITCPSAVSASVTYHKFSPGIYYNDSGTDRCLVAFREDTSTDPYVWMIPEDSSGDADGGSDSTYEVDADNELNWINATVVACIALDPISGKAYIMWGEMVADGQDLRRSVDDAPWSSWPASAEEEAGTCNRISCNIYPRNGSLKLAFVWLDDTTIKYDEYDIGQETAPALTAAEFPQQNYKVGPEKV